MDQLESQKIAFKYAKALMDAAIEQSELKAVSKDVHLLQSLYLDVPELKQFFGNPAIPVSEKQGVVEKQFKKGTSPMVGNLLQLLVENDRIALLPEILNCYIELFNLREGIAKAEVTVPVSISDDLERKLRSTLETLFGYQQVELNVTVDPAIIAGAIVRVGDKIIDGSYYGKLETLRRQVG